jgi:hypothetical protein
MQDQVRGQPDLYAPGRTRGPRMVLLLLGLLLLIFFLSLVLILLLIRGSATTTFSESANRSLRRGGFPNESLNRGD